MKFNTDLNKPFSYAKFNKFKLHFFKLKFRLNVYAIKNVFKALF